MMHLTQALILCRENVKAFQLMPVVFPFGELRQFLGRHNNVGTTVTAGHFTIIDTFQPDDDPLALPATFLKPGRDTLAVVNQGPVPVVQYSVLGVSIGVDLEPPLNPKHRGNLTNHSFLRMLSHTLTPVVKRSFNYSAAAPFSSCATRSLVWAP